MFLSFIVPVYNTAPYLRACLNTLLDQDLPETDYEILCIDDGSSDDSPEILLEYAAEHPNLRVLRQANSGVSAARNNGIDSAVGDYIWFVDSDDLIARNVLSWLRKTAEQESCDRIAFNYYEFQDSFTPEEQAAYEAGTLDAKPRYKDANVVTGILRRQIIAEHGLRFQPSSYGEDCLFAFEFLTHVKKQIVSERSLYYYRIHSHSASTTQTPEANRKRYEAGRTNVRVLQAYLEGKRGPIPNRQHCADLFMSTLWSTIWHISMMPRKQAKAALGELKREGLFPRKRPKECTLDRSYMTSRTSLYGKLFDFLYIHQASRLGYRAIRFLNLIRTALKR